MLEVKYLAHYDKPGSNGSRNYFLSAANKLDYIFETLDKLGIKTTVISACNVKDGKAHPAEEKIIFPNVRLKLLPTLKKGGKFSRIFAELIFRLRLTVALFKEVKRGDTLFVYHGLTIMAPVKLLKFFKKINLVLEIEEVYGDVLKKQNVTKRELKYFKKADAYLFASELLEQKINTEGKPFAVIYGPYRLEKEYNTDFNDNKIHLVYAGTLDPRKGGAAAAAAAAEYLPENYVIHILSGDSSAQIEEIIKETNVKGGAQVIFEGVKCGEEYSRFLQGCQIGFSTQNPDADFNNTSFPSKILSYLTNGLRVVSIRIPAIECSAVGSAMYYYDIQSPEEIAKAIENIDITSEYAGEKIVVDLNEKFKNTMERLLETLK